MARRPREQIEREAARAEFLVSEGFDARYRRHPEAPCTRADCAHVPRPCPFVGCRYNLYMDLRRPRAGRKIEPSIKVYRRDTRPEDIPEGESCALDYVDAHVSKEVTLKQLARLYRQTRERMRQIESEALERFKVAAAVQGIDGQLLLEVLGDRAGHQIGCDPAAPEDLEEARGPIRANASPTFKMPPVRHVPAAEVEAQLARERRAAGPRLPGIPVLQAAPRAAVRGTDLLLW